VTSEGHERVPVFRVGLTSNTTLRTLNRMICEFYGHPGTDRASAAQLASYVLDCVLSCESRVGIIDDIHFIDPRRKDGLDVSNHLKWLANELPVTFIYTGVGLAGRGLFAEGLTGQNAVLAQTGRRWTRLELPPFEIVSGQGRVHWQGLLKATERQLVLARARPGMLTWPPSPAWAATSTTAAARSTTRAAATSFPPRPSPRAIGGNCASPLPPTPGRRAATATPSATCSSS
jgi:hypothetical protein